MTELVHTVALIAAIPITAAVVFYALDLWLGRRRQQMENAYTDDDDTEIT